MRILQPKKTKLFVCTYSVTFKVITKNIITRTESDFRKGITKKLVLFMRSIYFQIQTFYSIMLIYIFHKWRLFYIFTKKIFSKFEIHFLKKSVILDWFGLSNLRRFTWAFDTDFFGLFLGLVTEVSLGIVFDLGKVLGNFGVKIDGTAFCLAGFSTFLEDSSLLFVSLEVVAVVAKLSLSLLKLKKWKFLVLNGASQKLKSRNFGFRLVMS